MASTGATRASGHRERPGAVPGMVQFSRRLGRCLQIHGERAVAIR